MFFYLIVIVLYIFNMIIHFIIRHFYLPIWYELVLI